MILLLTGIVLIALGILAGTGLVLAPFGLIPPPPGLSLWLAFPAFVITGYVLVIVGANRPKIRKVFLGASSLLLVLALAAAAGLVLAGASIVQPATSTLSLWFVLVIAGIHGVTGAASYNRTTDEA
ncbi:hypothetical protein SAMN05660284_00822 [Formivibrio citricus]|uniref:Uncharacterized protein n=1 Tax=Formivibrio citricus TaxID=83765 RepID=A0A1I4X0R9_9NEIS|nr:hypothetical protein [Formivibrio citricus]SFN19053.1 hypothetical protein SAMN05660284_00822 [Formivibrio citricus]